MNIFAAFAIVDATIDAILPSVLSPAFGVFMDLRYVGVGDIAKFKVMPNSLYTVSKGNYIALLVGWLASIPC